MTRRVMIGLLCLGLLTGLLACQAYLGPEDKTLYRGQNKLLDRNEEDETTDFSEDEAFLKFFYIINETGSNAEVRVLADDMELFLQEIGSQVPLSLGKEVPPLLIPNPAVELKVQLNKATQYLVVQDLQSGAQATFDIAGFSQVDAGFQITIQKDRILLSQDYYPAR